MLQSPLDLVGSRLLALVYGGLVYAAMFAVAAIVVRRGTAKTLTENQFGRVGSLDGLRGMLALGVFVHHSVTSYVWATTGVWSWGPNAVLNQLGQTTVALFFMTTGFLFALKAMKPIAWIGFYLTRIARLAPLYFLVVIAVFIIVFTVTGELRESPLLIARELLQWLAFVCFGRPDVNAFAHTWILIAGVNWSLKYEILFYALAVPMLYWLNAVSSSTVALAVVIVLLLGTTLLYRATARMNADLLYNAHFLGGIAVAYAYSIPRLRSAVQSAGSRWLGAVAALSLVFMVNADSAKAVAASILIFSAVIGNASMFGLLKTRPAIWLGDVSYGIYLLHGLCLWLAYRIVKVPLSGLGFVFFALVICMLAVVAATFSYLYLELPVMKYAKARRIPTAVTDGVSSAV